jgi:SAM-dependent methyltransferase
VSSRAEWVARYGAADRAYRQPSRWILERSATLAPDSLICDVAGGSGRHAVPLAGRGHRLVLLDFVEDALRIALRRAASIWGIVADARYLPLREASFDAVVVTNFLDRDLFPSLVALLKPGGRLLYETYTTEHAALIAAGLARAPRSASYLLHPGELRRLVQPLSITAYREGDIEDAAGRRACASVEAVRVAGN